MADKNEKFAIGSRRPWECTTNVNGGLMYFRSPRWVVEPTGPRVEMRENSVDKYTRKCASRKK